jgi:NTP pyrophosphatase (non-canonical NTP hydrolase)
MNIRDLQAEIAIWHAAQFFNVDVTRIVLKVGEETGELQREWERRLAGHPQPQNEQDEIADIVISLIALCARTGYDAETVIARKWARVRERTYNHSPSTTVLDKNTTRDVLDNLG